MSQSRSRSDDGGAETSPQDHNYHESERRWQQERLHREEAYYQFINELNDEDYRLMRDHNLLGTPGEITSEELQQRLDGVKEQLASQPDLSNREDGTNARDSEVPRENSNDSLLEWLNTFRRTGNATRTGQNGNQTWRAVSRTNPNSGEFRFSLEIHINHENRGFEIHGEDYMGIPLTDISRDHTRNRNHRSNSPVARRTRSQTSVNFSDSSSQAPRTRLGSRGQNSVEVSFSALGRLRNGIGASSGVPRNGAPHANFSGHTNQSGGSELRQREGQRFGAAHVWENEARSNVTVRNTNQRLEPIRLRSSFSSRSRSPIQRQSSTVYHNSQRESRPSQRTIRRSVRRRGVTRVFLEQDREPRSTTYTPFSNSRLVSRITVEEGEESSRSSAAVRRHPTITLDLQVRRIHPGENRDRDSIANRTRSRAGLAENTVTVESNSGGFRRTISRLERSGIRTYVSTITVPLRRISENELVEPSSVALRSILRQIMTGFGELSSLMEAESESEVQRNGQHLPEMHLASSDVGTGNFSSWHSEVSSRDRQAQDNSTEMPGADETTQPHAPPSENRSGRQVRNTNNLVETGTLPILRLAHFFLLNEGDDNDHIRGLTKEQIDNLSTRSYEHSGIDSELNKICSVCISDYVTGNKLRQLPCMHEFHIHCIDRWLSENCTCPICRQPVLGSSTANNG